MRILVTNDDGITAPGIKILEQMARQISDDVWVVAPDSEQSGKGHALTLTEPLRYRAISDRHFAVQGTPTDCVMMAVHNIVEGEKIDLVLSGINRGCNLAEDMTYSGTISAAMEGTICGIRSIAISQEVNKENRNAPFKVAEKHGLEIIKNLIEEEWEEGILMNVNFPPDPKNVKGIRSVRQGFRDDAELFIDKRDDLRGGNYFWIGFRRAYGNPKAGTDLEAIRDGYVSITPLHLDLTHDKTLVSLIKKMDKTF